MGKGKTMDANDTLRREREKCADLLAMCRGASAEALTARHLAVLAFLYREGRERRLGDIAKAVGAPKPSVTRAHQELQRRKWVRRMSNPCDGRDAFFALTEEGAAFMHESLAA